MILRRRLVEPADVMEYPPLIFGLCDRLFALATPAVDPVHRVDDRLSAHVDEKKPTRLSIAERYQTRRVPGYEQVVDADELEPNVVRPALDFAHLQAEVAFVGRVRRPGDGQRDITVAFLADNLDIVTALEFADGAAEVFRDEAADILDRNGGDSGVYGGFF